VMFAPWRFGANVGLAQRMFQWTLNAPTDAS
jgi:hypothetical protein